MTMNNVYWDHYINDFGGPMQNFSEAWSGYDIPLASPTAGYMSQSTGDPGVSWATLRDGSTVMGVGIGTVAVVLQANVGAGLWSFLTRSLAAWSLAYMPLEATIKAAQITLFGAASGQTDLPGAQVGWIRTDKPLVNDGWIDQTTDYVLTGDDLTLLTDLVDCDAVEARNPPPSGGSRDYLTQPSEVIWNLNAAGIAYLQEVFDTPGAEGRKAKFKLLLEWDRANIEPTHVPLAVVNFGARGRGYNSDDGLIDRSPRLRVWV